MSNVVGMAIRITSENAASIAVVNAGVVPDTERSLHNDEYFVFPYDPDAHCTILPGYAFRENFEFTSPRSETHFVEIREI